MEVTLVVVLWQAAVCLCNEEKPWWLPVGAAHLALRIYESHPFTHPEETHLTPSAHWQNLGTSWLSSSPLLIKHLCRCGPSHPSVTHGSKMHSALLLRSPVLQSRTALMSWNQYSMVMHGPLFLCFIYGHPPSVTMSLCWGGWVGLQLQDSICSPGM